MPNIRLFGSNDGYVNLSVPEGDGPELGSVPVVSGTPSDGDTLTYDAATGEWVPGSGGGSGGVLGVGYVLGNTVVEEPYNSEWQDAASLTYTPQKVGSLLVWEYAANWEIRKTSDGVSWPGRRAWYKWDNYFEASLAGRVLAATTTALANSHVPVYTRQLQVVDSLTSITRSLQFRADQNNLLTIQTVGAYDAPMSWLTVTEYAQGG